MKKILLALGFILIFSLPGEAQSTPSTLRVKTDANGYLVTTGAAQTSPLTTCVFSNCRLKVDASGNLVVVVSGGTFSGQLLAPASGTCTTPSYSFTGDANAGIGYLGADNIAGCAAGATIFDWNATRILSAVPINITGGTVTVSTPLNANTQTWNAGGVSFKGVRWTFTETASAAGSRYFEILGGAAGTTDEFYVQKGGKGFFADAVQTPAVYGSADIIYFGKADTTQIIRVLNPSANVALMQFNGVSSSFPAIKRNGTALNFRLADDSADAPISASTATLSSSLAFASLAVSTTAPTVPVACTSPTVTWSNGTATFQIDVGTSCTGVTTLAFTMPAVANGWKCDADSVTAPATSVVDQSGGNTTSVTLTNYSRTTGLAQDWADAADVRVSCSGG